MTERDYYNFVSNFLFMFHDLIILINVFGWMFERTRILNLVVLSLTTLSWFVGGIFYRIGYCILTDIHYQILYKLGERSLPNSYIKLSLDKMTDLNFDPFLVDLGTGSVFVICILGAGYVNWKKFSCKTEVSS